MNPVTRLLLLSLVLIPALAADIRAQSFDHEAIEERAFSVKAGQTLYLKSDLGSINVTGTSGNQVQVRVIEGVDGGSRSRAEDLFEKFEVTMEQTSRGVEITGDYPGRNFNWGRNGLRVAYEIRVPSTFAVDLNTAGGSISIKTLDGDVRMNTSGGSLSLNDIGGSVRGHTSGGSISAEHLGGTASLETSGGSINIADIDGGVKVHTSGGSISAEGIRGDLIAETSGGSIRVSDVSGSVRASTSGGGIVADLSGQPAGDVQLSTSGGSVTVDLNPGVRMDVDAHASGGGVRSEIPVTGRIEKNTIRGTLNGGGPLLSLHSSGGGVTIRER